MPCGSCLCYAGLAACASRGVAGATGLWEPVVHQGGLVGSQLLCQPLSAASYFVSHFVSRTGRQPAEAESVRSTGTELSGSSMGQVSSLSWPGLLAAKPERAWHSCEAIMCNVKVCVEGLNVFIHLCTRLKQRCGPSPSWDARERP
eukprot:1149134-Pelagomonas_calceolata.AAC.1